MTPRPVSGSAIWLAAGVRTRILRADGPFATRDSLALSVPVVRAMARQATGGIDIAVRGSVVLRPREGGRAPSRAVVSVCADGGVGTVALLQT